jgi:hypothetical protein
MMTLNYTQIFDETLTQKFKALVQSGHATCGVALVALKEQLDRDDESELDWVVSNLRRFSLGLSFVWAGGRFGPLSLTA